MRPLGFKKYIYVSGSMLDHSTRYFQTAQNSSFENNVLYEFQEVFAPNAGTGRHRSN